MVPKTERFEMRLDPTILDQVDAWRSAQSDLPSRAEAIRRLIEAGLTGSSSGPFRPSNSEKLVIWLLTEILKNQKGYENQDTVKLIQEAIYGGHFWALEWELTGVLHKHVDSPAAVTLVVDTLDMWSFIESAWAKCNKADKARIAAGVGVRFIEPKFIGFDGNNEGEYLGIARFLINKMERFESFKGRDLNSHMPKAVSYRHMIDLFEPIRVGLVGRELSVDEMITLLRRD
jgi:uncharacterized protein YfbU (UPF0304 family)